MSEYPKLMYVSNGTGQKRAVVLCKSQHVYIATQFDNMEDFLLCLVDNFKLSAYRFALDLPQPKKRPMNIYEFQKFCVENNPLIKQKGDNVWRTYLYYDSITEEYFRSKIKGFLYKLHDGTIGEFEVDE
jgi:hypothetical protein